MDLMIGQGRLAGSVPPILVLPDRSKKVSMGTAPACSQAGGKAGPERKLSPRSNTSTIEVFHSGGSVPVNRLWLTCTAQQTCVGCRLCAATTDNLPDLLLSLTPSLNKPLGS